jgi:hypothetical protein
MAKRPPKKRTAHVDDASKPGTSINVETNLLIAKGSVIKEFCDNKEEAGRRVFKINDAFNKDATKKADKEHLHRKAANEAYRLKQMEDEELHAYLYHFLFYVKDLGLLERSKKQEELFAAGDVGPGLQPNGQHQDDNSGADQEEPDGDKTSAHSRLGAAARQVAEQAGARLHEDH